MNINKNKLKIYFNINEIKIINVIINIKINIYD